MLSSQLILRIANGDEQAFKIVYEYFFPKIRVFARNMLHDDEQALEVAQDVLLAFWKMGRTLLEIRNPEGFLTTLSKRRTIDVLRKNIAVRNAERIANVAWQEGEMETEHRVAYNELRNLLAEGADLLPPQQRRAYQLCYEQGLKYEEAARVMEISPGTVQGHIKRALRFIRGYLSQHLTLTLLTVFI